jgi:hypothetical protein
MKNEICLFLVSFFSFSIIAQNDSVTINKPKVGVISIDKMNVVYRGVYNPISIAVPRAKLFTASGYGLKFKDGKYFIAPGQGLETIVKLDIELYDGSKILEEHKFRIKETKNPMGAINGKTCCEKCIIEMTKEELLNSKIEFKYSDDVLFDLDLSNHKITGFELKFTKNKKIYVSGDTFNKEAINTIKKSKTGSVFSINNIGYTFPGSENYLLPRLIPIKIMIVDNEIQVNYYESKEFIKDSLQNLKIQKKLVKKQLQNKSNF